MTVRGAVGGRRRFRNTRKGRRVQRGGEQEDFFREAENAECLVKWGPPKGGRRGKQTRSKRSKRPIKKQTHKRRK